MKKYHLPRNAALKKGKFFLLLFLCAGLFLGSCGNLYESASCEKDCRDSYNMCLYLALSQNRTPSGEAGNTIVLYLSCESAYTVCKDTCGGTSRL